MVSNKENHQEINNILIQNSTIEVMNSVKKFKDNPKFKKSNTLDSIVLLHPKNKNQKTKDKKTSESINNSYFLLMQRIMHEKLFYGQSNSRFNYDDYSMDNINKKQLNFQNSNWESTKKNKEKKEYDAPIVENKDLDKFLGKVIMMQNMGQATSDYTKPEGMSIDDFEKINNYKKINSGWIKIKYSLVSVS
ncbi:MAG: hypothetical protein PHV16_00130 [Candidatus Nanoarchaeia archaeon]|nr:hypothetical protein [Candidatus Nanoarchaeia archaeon]